MSRHSYGENHVGALLASVGPVGRVIDTIYVYKNHIDLKWSVAHMEEGCGTYNGAHNNPYYISLLLAYVTEQSFSRAFIQS